MLWVQFKDSITFLMKYFKNTPLAYLFVWLAVYAAFTIIHSLKEPVGQNVYRNFIVRNFPELFSANFKIALKNLLSNVLS